MAYMKKPNGKSYMRLITQEEIDKIKAKLKKEEEQKRWHTGTPTEKGWYLLALTTKVFNDKPLCVAYMDGHHWLGIDDFYIFVDDVVAWQKIEPYKETDNECK